MQKISLLSYTGNSKGKIEMEHNTHITSKWDPTNITSCSEEQESNNITITKTWNNMVFWSHRQTGALYIYRGCTGMKVFTFACQHYLSLASDNQP